MDSKEHPVVQQGIKAAELVSDVRNIPFLYIKNFIIKGAVISTFFLVITGQNSLL